MTRIAQARACLTPSVKYLVHDLSGAGPCAGTSRTPCCSRGLFLFRAAVQGECTMNSIRGQGTRTDDRHGNNAPSSAIYLLQAIRYRMLPGINRAARHVPWNYPFATCFTTYSMKTITEIPPPSEGAPQDLSVGVISPYALVFALTGKKFD
jgi:hypothetical protein